jgi:FAD/FMN-containing dehydrogenase
VFRPFVVITLRPKADQNFRPSADDASYRLSYLKDTRQSTTLQEKINMDMPMIPSMSYATAVDDLRAQVHGAVYERGDAGYEEARLAWNRSNDQNPAYIVMPERAWDVVEAVQFARDYDLKVAVQGTGHGLVRATADDAVLINMERMGGIEINAEAQSAWVEAGVLWGDVLEQAQVVGLAPLLGSSPNVGVVGYTLGGGMGWLARKYGLSADSVIFMEVVTADGRLRRISPVQNADLFWAIRGGGAGFGIVVGMEIKLYPVTEVFGGNMMFPAQYAKEAFRIYREWAATLPDEFTTAINIMNFPPAPQVPEPVRGKSFVIVRGLYSGAPEEGEAMMDVWYKWQTPVVNSFRAMQFAEAPRVSQDPLDPMPARTVSEVVYELSDELVDVLCEYMLNGKSPIAFVEFRQGGGAIARVDQSQNAIGNRDAGFFMEGVGMTPTPEAVLAFEQYAERFKNDLKPFSTGGMYLNFAGREKTLHPEKAYAPEVYQRLRALKAQYDPENRFTYGFNITPAE